MMMTNRWLFPVFALLMMFAMCLWTPAEVYGQAGYSRLGTTVLVGTNGVVSRPSTFWLDNVVAAGDLAVDLDSLGRLRLSLQLDTNSALSVYWDALLDIPTSITQIADGLRLPVMRSSTVEAWTDAGGTQTNEGVIATSPLLTNGVAAVEYDASGLLPVIVQMSPDGSVWSDLAATNTAMMVRLLATNTVPAPGEATVTVSNIVATSWTHPALFGTQNDTAGQVLLVDTPADDRAAVNLATMQAAIAAGVVAASPDQWAAYPASEPVKADRIVLGGAWAVEATTNGLVISGGGIELLTFTDGDGTETGLNVAALTLDGLVATIDISTNGVAGRPLAQWSALLEPADWQTLTPTSETYPDLETNGYYRIVATLPDDSGFVRAVYEAAKASASVRAHVLPAASGLYDLGSGAAPWRAAYLDALIVGGTNVMTALAGKQPAGSYVTTADTNGWETGSHADFVTDADTNGWETGSHTNFPTLNAPTNTYSGTQVFPAISLGGETRTNWPTGGWSSATRDPYLIPCTTNITISAANGIQQAVTGAVPASVTLNFPTGSATSELIISLTFPPAGTNEVLLASGPTYYYVSPLASDATASTSLYTRYYITSPYGSTNVAVTAMGEVQ